MMSSVCSPTETAAYSEYEVSLYSWMKAGLRHRSSRVSTYCRLTCIPANRFGDGYQEILGLFRNGREGLEDDVAVLWANPNWTRRVVGLEMKPREVLLVKYVRYKGILLLPVRAQARHWLSIL